MSLNNYNIIHRFFKENALNNVYLSVFLTSIAVNSIGIFSPIYLYQSGFEVPEVLLFFILKNVFFVFLAFLFAGFVARIGPNYSMLISAPLLSLYFFGLSYVVAYPVLFYILPFILALAVIFYNFGFHLNFLDNSHKDKRGSEVSFLRILNSLTAAITPFFAGMIIYYYNYNVLFVIGALILILSMVPLFWIKNGGHRKISYSSIGLINYLNNRKYLGNYLSFTGYAIESSIGGDIWPIYLLIVLASTVKVGLVVTLSLVVSVVTLYGIGRVTDKYAYKDRLVKFGTMLYFFGWVGRIFANTDLKVLLVDTYKNTSERVLQVPWSTISYDLASREDHYLYIVSREIVFNLSRVLVMPLVMLIFYFDFYPFAVSFGIAALFTLLYPFLSKTSQK